MTAAQRPGAVSRERRAGRRRKRQARMLGLARLVVFLLLVFVAVWAGVRVANASGDSQVFEGRRYEVRAGDTLWTIASREYGDDKDLRELVYEIRLRNHIDGALLQPGERIVLPYEGEDGASDRR